MKKLVIITILFWSYMASAQQENPVDEIVNEIVSLANNDRAPTDAIDSARQIFVTPDLEQIKRESNDRQSPHYFRTLAKRFAQADTSLTIEELQAFYLGAAFQKDFNPDMSFAQYDTILEMLDREGVPSKAELKRALALTEKLGKAAPADICTYYYQHRLRSLLAEHYGGSRREADKAETRFLLLWIAIASTGDGTSWQKAMYVTRPSHEKLMMYLYDFQPKEPIMIWGAHLYDAFRVKQYGVDTLFFNVDVVRPELMPVANYTCNIADGATDIPGGPFVLQIFFDRKMLDSIGLGRGRDDREMLPYADEWYPFSWNEDHTVLSVRLDLAPHTAYSFSITGPNFIVDGGGRAKGSQLIDFTTGD